MAARAGVEGLSDSAVGDSAVGGAEAAGGSEGELDMTDDGDDEEEEYDATADEDAGEAERDEAHTVQCNDGTIEVSAKAVEWMATNFPMGAAAKAPKATLQQMIESNGLNE